MHHKEKWNYWTPIALQNLLSTHDCLPLRHMDKDMVMKKVNNNTIEEFQVGYMSYTGLNHNMGFIDCVKNTRSKLYKILQANNAFHK